jgi:hypothetical protein
MNWNMMVSLCVPVLFFSSMAIAQTPVAPTTQPPVSSGKTEQSNKGGQLRGLDRADQAAGQHGQQGRDTARDAQLNRPNHPEQPNIPERSNSPERPAMPGRRGR